MSNLRVRVAGPAVEQRSPNERLFRAEVAVTLTYDLAAVSKEDADLRARRLARGIVYNEEIQTVTVKQVDLVEQMRVDNLRGWLESEAVKLLTDEQQRRHEQGQLAEEELLTAARHEIFRPFTLPRWKPLKWNAVQHVAGCVSGPYGWTDASGNPAPGHVELHSQLEDIYRKDPSDDRWWVSADVAGSVRSMSDEASRHPWLARSSAVPVCLLNHHVAVCRVCSSKLEARSVIVRVEWAGRILSREYAL